MAFNSMKKQSIVLSLLFGILLIIGCSSTPNNKSSVQINKPQGLVNSTTIKTALYQQHQQWKGTRYQWGGLSKNGIDCSGIVYLTYLEKLSTPIPRTTLDQAQIGTKIEREELRAGDLVFFKTSKKVRHVGIYIEDNKFLHASTKKGVMVSTLDDYYWKDRYWHARRVMF